MTQKAAPPIFLLSFIPAIAYWYLETNYTLEVALVGGIILGLVEMGLEKWFTKHVHTLSKLNIALVVVLGIVSIVAREGIWFKLQPTFTGLSLASFLVYKRLKGQSLMVEMQTDMGQKLALPAEVYKLMEWHLCLFLVGFAAFMAYVAAYEPTSTWLFWKTGGFYIAFGAFFIIELFFLRWFLRRIKQ